MRFRWCAVLEPRDGLFFCCPIWIYPDDASDFTNAFGRLV